MERDSGQSFESILSKYRDHDNIKKVTSAFWNLFKCDQTGHIKYDSFKAVSKTKTSFLIIEQLLIRFLKVLVPCFKSEEDYSKYCLEEWRSATHLQNTMNFDRFHRAVFKIPHSWAINLDVNEYARLLELLYDRVTARRVYSPERSKDGQLILPNIFVQFPAEEETVLETIAESKAQVSQGKQSPSAGAQWEQCDSEQSVESRYEYNFIEDEKEMAMKKQKRLKQTKKVHSLTQRLKQPIYYKECVEYSSESHPSPIFPVIPPSTNAIENPVTPLIWKVVLAPLDQIIPFGCMPEQFLMKIKNDSSVQQRPQSSTSSARKDAGGAMIAEVGDIIKSGQVYRDTSLKIQPFTPSSTTAKVCNRFFIRKSQIVSDILWHKCNNNMEIYLRLQAQRNLPGPRDITTPPVLNNKTRCNPVLDRRIIMELHRVFEKAQYVNVNYIVPDEKITQILRSDLMRVENPEYLAMKPSAAPSGPMGTTHMSGFNDVMKRPILHNEKTIFELDKQMIGSKFQAISKQRTKALQKENRKKREEENARREAEGENEESKKKENDQEVGNQAHDQKAQEEQNKKQQERLGVKQSESRASHRKEKTPSPKPGKGDVSATKAGDISNLSLKTANLDSKYNAEGQIQSGVSKNQSYLTGRDRQTVVQNSILYHNNGILPNSMQPPTAFPQMTKCLMPQLLSRDGIKCDPLNNDHDFIKDAGKLPLSILIIGNSKSGKTTLARNLASRLDIVHIEVTIILNALFKKIAQYQPPDDIPDGEEPPKFLTELEQSVQNTLKSGQELSQQQVFSLINSAIESDAAQSKGFVIVLPFSRNGMKWGEMISNNVFPKMPAASISYIFELKMSKQDSLLRAENTLISNEEAQMQTDGSGMGVFSRFDRAQRKRIYQDFKKKMEEDDDFAAEVTQENTPKQPLNENTLVKRERDDPGLLKAQFDYFMTEEYPHFLNLKKQMFNLQYIRLNSGGVSPVELAAACEVHVKETNPLRPLGIILDPESDFKALLTQNVEQNQVPRVWSPWRQTDPVPLLENGKVIPGTPQFGSKYAGRVFVHSSQETQKKFIANPKRYTAINPQMPLCHRLAILGPKGSGRRQIGKRMCDIYGWKYVDIDKIAQDKLQQQQEIENRQVTVIRQSVDIDQSMENPNRSIDPNQKRSRAGSRTSRKSGTRSKQRTPSKIGSRKGSHTKTMSKEEPPNPHIPNNPEEGGHVGFNIDEYNNVIAGGAFKATDVTAWILEVLGIQLQEYREPPPPPPEKNQDDEDNDEVKQNTELKDQTAQQGEEDEEQDGSKQDVKQTPRDGTEREQGVSSPEIGTKTPEPIMPRILQDLPINQISVKVDQNWKPPFIGGFVFVAFPENEQQFSRLKQQGIEFDKIIILNDTDEENPGKELKTRNELRNLDYEHQAEMEFLEKLKETIKQQIGEENLESVLMEVSCNGSIEEVLTRVRLIVDPFYSRLDSQDNIRVAADVNEPDQQDEAQIKKNPENKGISQAIPISKCSLGDFCPVTYFNQSWLFPGGVTGQNLESYLNGRIFKFAGEKQMEAFNTEPLKYLGPGDEPQISNIQPIPPPLPHILMTGPRGSGVTTQIKKLSKFYQIETQNIQQDFLMLLRQAKNQRKRERLLKRGFKAPPMKQDQDDDEGDDDNKQEEQQAVDPQIDEDPQQFEKGDHQKQLMKEVMQPGEAKFYDGGWFDINEEEVTTSYLDLLTDSRRLPQYVILFTISEKKYLERLLDTKGITAKYERQMAELRRARKQERERLKQEKMQERKRAIQAGQIDPDQINDEQAPMDEDQQEDEELEGDDVPNLEEMLTTEREKLTERRDKDSQWIDGIAQEFKAKKIPVAILNADLDISIIHTKIKHALHDHLQLRQSLIQRQHARPVRSVDSSTFISSYIYRRSKFFNDSLFTPTNPVKTLKYPAIYRERFFFFSSQDEREKFLKQPLKHSNIGLANDCESVQVDDVKSPSTAFVVGMPKSGRTTLCQKIASECGQVLISMDTIIKDFLKSDCILADQVRNELGRGKSLNDQKVIEILKIRLQQADCVKYGWILDGYPQSIEQARMLSENAGIIPKYVFEISIPQNVVMQRSLGSGNSDDMFGSDMRVIHARISKNQKDLPLMCKYYDQRYKNLRVFDGCKSKWYLISRAKHCFTQVQESIKQYTRGILQKKPVKLQNLNVTNESLLRHLSKDFQHYCPVTLKLKRKLYDCRDIQFIAVEYLQTVYLLKGESEWEAFKENPQRFIKKQSLPKNLPQMLSLQKCGELANDAKGLQGYCPVSLVDQQRLILGNTMFAASNGNMEFVFESYEKLVRFMETPQRYETVSLPVKMPPAKQHIRLDSLADGQDSVAFLEEAVGNVVSKALLEINSKRIKHPNLSVKQTALKLFSLYLKANNPAANMFVRQKYGKKLSQFIERCELPIQLLRQARKKKNNPEEWQQFEEENYHEQGKYYDRAISQIQRDKEDNFISYIR